MKCPHCSKECNSLILETRKQDDSVVRKRACGGCGKSFLSEERVNAELKMVRYRPGKDKNRRVPEKLKVTGRDLFTAWR